MRLRHRLANEKYWFSIWIWSIRRRPSIYKLWPRNWRCALPWSQNPSLTSTCTLRLRHIPEKPDNRNCSNDKDAVFISVLSFHAITSNSHTKYYVEGAFKLLKLKTNFLNRKAVSVLRSKRRRNSLSEHESIFRVIPLVEKCKGVFYTVSTKMIPNAKQAALLQFVGRTSKELKPTIAQLGTT